MWQWYYDPAVQMKMMRRQCSIQGWTLLVYLGIMNVAVIIATVAAAVFVALQGQYGAQAEASVNAISGWGYFLAIGIGLLILLLWKRKEYFTQVLFRKGRTMKAGKFFGLLSIFLSAQLIMIIASLILDIIMQAMGITHADTGTVSMDSWSMFLYVALGAPISEELLFRGVVLRGLAPYGKRFSIFASAMLFGLFHGNLTQAPFAFLVGVVLGYVALEYNILWAMVLHMFNNLIVADTLSRLGTMLWGEMGGLLTVLVILVFGIAAFVTVILWWKRIWAYFRRTKGVPHCGRAFFSAPGIIVLLVILILSTAFVEIMAFVQ
jgi:membrane protease YdiL (CAAX protease family)